MGFFSKLQWYWILPWSKADPSECHEVADYNLGGYHGSGPVYGVYGEVDTVRGGWKGHKESWEWEDEVKGGDPDPIGNSLFCIHRQKSMIDLVQGYDPETRQYFDLESGEEERVRLAIEKSKNKWRWF